VHEKFQEEVLYVTRAGTEELKTHDGGQIDRYSTGCPKIKWACARRLQEEALHTAKGQEPKNRHRVTEARQDKHSTGRPKIKWACAKGAPRRSLLYSKDRS